MVDRRDTLKVAVNRQVLWVGAEAYPVNNIARAQTIAVKPGRVRAVFRFLGYVLLWTVLAFAAAFAVDALGLTDQGAGLLPNVPFLVGGALILVSFIMLIRTLSARTLYALIIETSGSPHSALVTDNQGLLREIVNSIMDAINNPHVTYGPISVQNFQVGKVGIIGDNGRIGALHS